MSGPQVVTLPDGRLHLNHGPIDLICQAWGPGREEGLRRAILRFDGLLEELVAELPALRSGQAVLSGPIARRMGEAVAPYRPAFITPMAAVAGAVAEAVLAALCGAEGVERAFVNNGGDIALHLGPGKSLICALPEGGSLTLRAEMPVRGIATSGWRGRSWSLGIADAVTVLARSAADADAAATMIANAVDLPGHPGITRRPAQEMQADSDLGPRPVTVAVAALTPAEVAEALHRGQALAEGYRARGLIEGAALFLQGEMRATAAFALPGVLRKPKEESEHV